MIKTKKDLNEYINSDNTYFNNRSKKAKFFMKITSHSEYKVAQFTKFLRKQEYYGNTANGNKFKIFLHLYYEKRKNVLGNKLGFLIEENCFGKGLQLYHHGTIIVNPKSRVGENCCLRGNNCIGFAENNNQSPVLGDNVTLGFGCVVVGEIKIADNIKIGANAVVTKSFLNAGDVLVGVPASVLIRK